VEAIIHAHPAAPASKPAPRKPRGTIPLVKPLRFIPPLLAAISLLLAVAAAVLWGRSYTGSDYVSRQHVISSAPGQIRTRVDAIMWCKGDVRLSVTHLSLFMDVPYPLQSVGPLRPTWTLARLGKSHVRGDPLPVRSLWNRLGFFTYENGLTTSFSDSPEHGIAFPAWLPVLAFAIPPMLWLRHFIRTRRRYREGLCRKCGYDLRATPERCPECGTVTAGAKG
jgi:hypothetical protein